MSNFEEENNIVWIKDIKEEPVEAANIVAQETAWNSSITEINKICTDKESVDCVQEEEITEIFNNCEHNIKTETGSPNEGDCYKEIKIEATSISRCLLSCSSIVQESEDRKSTLPVRRVQEKSNVNSYCPMCRQEFREYCLKCQMLSHILNKSISTNSGARQTIPTNLLYLKETPEHIGVFALKNLPKGVKFGPFEGLDQVSNGTVSKWKIKNRKLLICAENVKYSNWMQFVNNCTDNSQQNLVTFQCNNNLYYKSICEIKADDELLVYFGEEYMNDANANIEIDYDPIVEDEMDNVFGCTFCMLGFSSEVYLVKHKTNCPKGMWKSPHGNSIAKIVQCSFCNLYLEHKEYTDYHMNYCCEKYARNFLSSTADLENAMGTQSSLKTQLNKIYNVVEKKHKCTECSYQTNDRHDLKKHEYKHSDVKPFKCHLCRRQFTQKGHLKMHMKNKHDAVDEKEFKCRFCPYQTNSKGDLKLHLYIHDTIKRFECEMCGKRFRQKANLQVHLKNLHLAANSKKFKCPSCPFKTNYKNSLDKHVNNTHRDVAPVVCHLCNGHFKQKQTLQQHIKYKHAAVVQMEYRCPVCPYESKRKGCLKRHLSIHDEIKSHGCPKCEYKTNCKNNLRHHMYKHLEVKPHSCAICGKEFARKGGLKAHIKCMHGGV